MRYKEMQGGRWREIKGDAASTLACRVAALASRRRVSCAERSAVRACVCSCWLRYLR